MPGWLASHQEPTLDADKPTEQQRAQLTARADLVQLYRDAVTEGQ